MRAIALGALAGSWLVLTACDPVVSLEVQLTLPVDYMETLDYPVQFAFETDAIIGDSETLCGAAEQEYYIVLEDGAIGCAEPMEVRVAAGPWNAPSTGCVVEDGNSYSQILENGGSQITSASAFAGASASPCRGGEEIVRITLGE